MAIVCTILHHSLIDSQPILPREIPKAIPNVPLAHDRPRGDRLIRCWRRSLVRRARGAAAVPLHRRQQHPAERQRNRRAVRGVVPAGVRTADARRAAVRHAGGRHAQL